MEVCDHNQYALKVDGSGRLTKRYRRFLRSFKPASLAIDNAPLSNFGQSHRQPETSTSSDVGESHEPVIPPLLVPSRSININEEPCPVNVPEIEAPPTPPYTNNTVVNRPPVGNTTVPAMLKRILPFNSDGRREGIVTPEDGGRRTRSRDFNI